VRILLISDSYPPLVGGATRAAKQLADAMAARGHAVEVVTVAQPGAAEREAEGAVVVNRVRSTTQRFPGLSEDPYRENAPPYPDPELVARIRRIVGRFGPDVVHSYGWLTPSAALALTGTDVPMLLSIRDYGNFCAKRTLFRDGAPCDGPAPRKCLSCAGSHYGALKGTVATIAVLGSRGLIRRRVRGLHSCSGFAQEMAHRFLADPGESGLPDVSLPDWRDPDPADPGPPAAPGAAGLPEANLLDPDPPAEADPDRPAGADPLPPADPSPPADPDPTPAPEAADPEILAALPEQPFILFVGALRKIKGIEQLLAAYDRLADPSPLVLIGGQAPDTPPIPDGVTVLGSVPHPTVMAAWDRALFGVFPSILPEPLGNVIHEAMSRGRPVIGTHPGGHAEMITDGETGFLVPSNNVPALTSAMSRLITDPDLRESMGAKARESAERFTAATVVPRFEQLYREVAATR
jgi:glycosyltransferase involved in cell wall biosynthesis